ncbi:hypothetical protein W97_07865 [Coniosporium apollinis CBS 100218]|uniref:Tudor domain-containing protein n=1 Tax=Coniosporium apollinis (strain CBS 100218) TaxID=1168221 RepID=R7Z392_CONA1|nr:uncharacterized protein W97_07865 [Coniosporium apollinis CBS 100218]EON68607.1 hypothetical protein W97_07865 [Coniosporium apollinis CBS 100218]
MSSELASLEAEEKEFSRQLEEVELGLQADPESADLRNLKAELEQLLTLQRDTIAELRAAETERPGPRTQRPSTPPAKEKWSKENHPAYQAGYRKPTAAPQSPVEEAQAPTKYKPNDMVMAKWKTGDKGFYPARITSVTGSAADPVYYVTFKGYNDVETLKGSEIKPMLNESKKRKADGTAVATAPAATSGNSSVISAAASIDPALASQARKEPSKVSDGPPKPAKVPRKVKANKELEAGKSKWNDFQTKGKLGKMAKKDSMFRTPEGVNARVGFTGSGQAMRKDPTRSRHIYQVDDNEGY